LLDSQIHRCRHSALKQPDADRNSALSPNSRHFCNRSAGAGRPWSCSRASVPLRK
jgi:hypothetical protein